MSNVNVVAKLCALFCTKESNISEVAIVYVADDGRLTSVTMYKTDTSERPRRGCFKIWPEKTWEKWITTTIRKNEYKKTATPIDIKAIQFEFNDEKTGMWHTIEASNLDEFVGIDRVITCLTSEMFLTSKEKEEANKGFHEAINVIRNSKIKRYKKCQNDMSVLLGQQYDEEATLRSLAYDGWISDINLMSFADSTPSCWLIES